MNEFPRWLFSKVAVMEVVGFNARAVEEGLTKPGEAQRKTKPRQGPLSPQCLAATSSQLSREQLESLFNQMVQGVVGWGRLDGERLAALDGSKLETPAPSEGRGRAQREAQCQGQRAKRAREGGRRRLWVEGAP